MKKLCAQLFAGCLLFALSVGCTPKTIVPLVFRPEEPAARVPVVFIPGTTGTALVDKDSGAIRWGTVGALLKPRDLGYELALPIPPDHPQPDRGLRASHALRSLAIRGIYRKPIYGPWVDVMEANGYATGDLDHPRPDDTFFLFAYDWRKSNVDAAAQLFAALERVRIARGESRLRVHLIAQSNGALIARYLARFGDATLEEAESGRAKPPPTLSIERLLMVGAANGGSIRVLREMHRGRTYLRWLGRNWAPEVLFTFPGLYEGLPVYRQRFFVDENAELLDLDLFDVETWIQHDLSIFNPKSRKRADRVPALFGDEAQRRNFAGAQLQRARRLQELLTTDPEGFRPGRYLLVQNGLTSTPDRAYLHAHRGGWKLEFSDADRVRKDPMLLALTEAPGDEHATLASQIYLSERERHSLQNEAFYAVGGHFEMILNPAAQKRCLQFLKEP